VVIHSTPKVSVTIGDNVSIDHSAILHGCTIGNNVIIGMGSIILDNLRVDDWVLVGAGSVITSDSIIPSRSLVLGVPGNVARQLYDDEINRITNNAEELLLLKVILIFVK
jgi:carbonic anhydrase/acetyltransferase-like protein (isoleucine patch superfamily)